MFGRIQALVGKCRPEARDIGTALGADPLGSRAALRAQEYGPGR